MTKFWPNEAEINVPEYGNRLLINCPVAFEKKQIWHWAKINSYILLGNQGVIGEEWDAMAESVDIREWVKTGGYLGDPFIAGWDYERKQSAPGDFTIYFYCVCSDPQCKENHPQSIEEARASVDSWVTDAIDNLQKALRMEQKVKAIWELERDVTA